MRISILPFLTYHFSAKRSFKFLFIALIFCGEMMFAQELKIKFHRLTTDDGLSHEHVLSSLKDKKGFMWFATQQGVSRYDGYGFTVYKHSAQKNNSLKNNLTFDLLEDEQGSIWVATGSGLNKFNHHDGSFSFIEETEGLIIRDLFMDHKNRIWLGTSNGLYLFEKSKGITKVYKHSPADNNSISHDFVYKITEDEGILWIASMKGLNRFDPETEEFTYFLHDPEDKNSISGNHTRSVMVDSKKRIWISILGGGLSLFDREQNRFVNFNHEPDNSNSLSHDDARTLLEGNDGRIWVGTENGGISILDYGTKTFTNYKNDLFDTNSLSHNSIYSIYKDDIGNIWIGTYAGGVNFVPNVGEKFKHYRTNPFDKNSLSNNLILGIHGDSKGNIIIGTDGGGINYLDRKTRKFTHFRNEPDDPNSISSDYVYTAIEYKEDVLAAGYYRGGFDLINLKTGAIKHHLPDTTNPESISAISIGSALKDKNGKLWLGTADKGGLNLYDPETATFEHFQPTLVREKYINGGFVYVMYEDKMENFWIGTDDGLVFFDRKNKVFLNYKHDSTNSQNIVNSILEDKHGNLWIGTVDAGLNYFNTTTKEFTAYTTDDGLPGNTVYGMLEDNNGNIWFSSNKGLSIFDPATTKCRNYGLNDGVQANSFKPNVCYKTPDGEMFFGGVNGINSFYPDSIEDNTFIPPIFITDLQIFNKSVEIGVEGSPLKRSILDTKSITIDHDQTFLTFEFAALNFTNSQKNQYAYKLEGFDKDWIYSGDKRNTTYTNLDPGRYVFMVKGSNNDDEWNEVGASLEIIVTPPFYQTWWFRAIIACSLLGMAISFSNFRMNRIHKQKQNLEKQVLERTTQIVKQKEELQEQKEELQTINEELESQKKEIIARKEAAEIARREAEISKKEAESANQAKSSFLATMSHEIRTPMNGVIGVTSLLTQTALSQEQKEYTGIIQRSGEALVAIINDILDFSKIESNMIELEESEFDLQNCIEEVVDLFSSNATKKELELLYFVDKRIPEKVIGDSHRLKQILINLVGNAYKFTEKGEIYIEVKTLDSSGDQLTISFQVRDTGIGIPEEKQSRLFKAFSQIDPSTTRKYGGTGLGLAISQRLVSILGGEISVESKLDEGTRFIFTIPLKTTENAPVRDNISSLKILSTKKILVIDDNLTSLHILDSHLKYLNLKPSLANSATKSIKILEENSEIEIILLDLNIGDTDGISLAQLVKGKKPDSAIILMNPLGNEIGKEHLKLFTSVIAKPVKPHLLYETLNGILGKGELSGEEISVPVQKPSKDFAMRHPMKILVAEDNPVNQIMVRMMLNKMGYEPKIVANGHEAIEICNEQSFDIILMDIQMPELDGLESCKRIRSNTNIQQPFIVALTANAMKEDRDICMEAGMNDYITKPFKIELLMSLLRKIYLEEVVNG